MRRAARSAACGGPPPILRGACSGHEPTRPSRSLQQCSELVTGQARWLRSAGRGSARGSIDSPSGIHTFAPLLAIVVVSRVEWVRRCAHPHDLEHDDWLAQAGPNGIWDDVPVEADPEHPAPFHIEVPRRLIKFAGCPADLVGDLWLGRGTTALACIERFHGGDRSATYVAISEDRVAAALDQQQAA
jgi:site-specific DNA-methyltransferase (adenine-specific)